MFWFMGKLTMELLLDRTFVYTRMNCRWYTALIVIIKTLGIPVDGCRLSDAIVMINIISYFINAILRVTGTFAVDKHERRCNV